MGERSLHNNGVAGLSLCRWMDAGWAALCQMGARGRDVSFVYTDGIMEFGQVILAVPIFWCSDF